MYKEQNASRKSATNLNSVSINRWIYTLKFWVYWKYAVYQVQLDLRSRFRESSCGHFSYLLELWDDLMFLAEMMFRDRTASAALSSTSALFLMRPGGTQSSTTHQHLVIRGLKSLFWWDINALFRNSVNKVVNFIATVSSTKPPNTCLLIRKPLQIRVSAVSNVKCNYFAHQLQIQYKLLKESGSPRRYTHDSTQWNYEEYFQCCLAK